MASKRKANCPTSNRYAQLGPGAAHNDRETVPSLFADQRIRLLAAHSLMSFASVLESEIPMLTGMPISLRIRCCNARAASTNGNENGMVLKEVTLNAAGTAIVGSPRTFNGIGGTSARFAVLWSGR